MTEQAIQMDYMNPQGGIGEVAGFMINEGRLDTGRMRPYIGSDGRMYMTIYSGRGKITDPKNYRVVPIQTNAVLRRDELLALDEALLQISETVQW